MAEETKPCVACAEEIKAKAVLCKHCKTRQDDEAFTSPIEVQTQDTKKENPIPRLVTIAGAASAVFLLVMWGVLAFAFPSSTEQEDEANQSVQAEVSAEAAPVPAGKLTQIGFLEIGDCLNDSYIDRSEPTDSVFAVQCSDLHDSQVIATIEKVVGSSWDKQDVRTQARQFCADQFVLKFRGEPAPSQFTWRAHFSTEDLWSDRGFVDFVCVLSASNGQTVGQIDVPDSDQTSEAQADADSSNGTSNPQSRGNQSSPAPNPIDEVEQQRQQLQQEIDEQNAAFEAQQRADAIADYERKLDLYASEVATRIVQIEQLYAEQDAAYADFQNTFGIPYQRGNNSGCNSVDDFFGCIREHAAMPLFEFSIGQLESDIDFYIGLADSLVAPY